MRMEQNTLELLRYNWSKYSYDELERLVIKYITEIFAKTSDTTTRDLVLKSYNALQDEESKQIYHCLFLWHTVGINMPELMFTHMVMRTLKNRLIEKGTDLSAYNNNYDVNFFFDNQYFALPQIKHTPDEDDGIFIDCGAFDGSTVKDFVKYCGGKYNKIYSFEPIPRQYENCLQNIQKWGIERVEFIQKGVWSSKAAFNFLDGGPGSCVSAGGTVPVEVIDIDSAVAENEKVTFIKMDVEGAELEALKGAYNTIRRCKPKLAVCIYHKPSDIIEIPLWISAVLPDYNYRFYIRHHYVNRWETVLYALPDVQNA